MVSERTQRQIDRLLDEAEDAMRQLAWDTVRARVQAVLSLDPENQDARNYLAAAERAMGLRLAQELGMKPLVQRALQDKDLLSA